VDRRRHQVYDTDPILAALGLAGVEAAWRPGLPDSLVAEGRRALADARLDRGALVGVAPAAAWGLSKRWPPERFGELAARLVGRGFRVAVLVGPGEEDVAAAVQRASGRELPVLGTELDIAGLAAVMTQLEALACNDTGPMHLAALVGTPVVAVFGPTDPARTAPVGVGHLVVRRDLECAPCLERVCPLGHGACLVDLGVEEVFEPLLGLLRDRPRVREGSGH
jgi:heptosyltransferase-2